MRTRLWLLFLFWFFLYICRAYVGFSWYFDRKFWNGTFKKADAASQMPTIVPRNSLALTFSWNKKCHIFQIALVSEKKLISFHTTQKIIDLIFVTGSMVFVIVIQNWWYICDVINLYYSISFSTLAIDFNWRPILRMNFSIENVFQSNWIFKSIQYWNDNHLEFPYIWNIRSDFTPESIRLKQVNNRNS